jgi:hypothetical protein
MLAILRYLNRISEICDGKSEHREHEQSRNDARALAGASSCGNCCDVVTDEACKIVLRHASPSQLSLAAVLIAGEVAQLKLVSKQAAQVGERLALLGSGNKKPAGLLCPHLRGGRSCERHQRCHIGTIGLPCRVRRILPQVPLALLGAFTSAAVLH